MCVYYLPPICLICFIYSFIYTYYFYIFFYKHLLLLTVREWVVSVQTDLKLLVSAVILQDLRGLAICCLAFYSLGSAVVDLCAALVYLSVQWDLACNAPRGAQENMYTVTATNKKRLNEVLMY